MDDKAKRQLGELLVDQDKLLEVLSANTQALDEYPELQQHLLLKSQNSIAFRKALRDKTFTKEEYRDAILLRLDWIGYELASSLDLDFLIQRVAALVGSDLESIKTLSIQEIGEANLSKLLHMMGSHIIAHPESNKSRFPWQSVRGQANPAFWRRADLAFDMYQQGYNSHWKLNSAFKDKYDIPVPQSFVRFVRDYGDPRLIPEWTSWKEES
ncbi:hypothetical protein GCM10007895_14290 [Paraferrimonas sedimenticola]|uniref:Uncharacterized protein n=2 Tax=Paraferrimonas sedimenticola TaxID=375674 RepID=A0AA37RW46_9GAMM|nr:hypothetical protein GCM10007895_14290 [Paraferrimonas sedimenticola]